MSTEEDIKQIKQEIEIILKQVSDMDARVIYIKNLVEAIAKNIYKPKPIIGELG